VNQSFQRSIESSKESTSPTSDETTPTTDPEDRPVWFLDIDGVINAITYACPEGFEEGSASPGEPHGSYPIHWNPYIIEAINEMHDKGWVEVQWLTTWGSGANGELRELVGLQEFTVAAEPPLYAWGSYNKNSYTTMDDRPSWWKHAVVQDFHAKNPSRKIVWTDDDLAFEKEASNWVKGKKILAIAPRQAESLRMSDIARIRTFLRSPSA
jgi:hypothetical protein